MIRFKCQGCGKALTAPDANAGETGRCPYCEELFDIPTLHGGGTKRPAGVLRVICPGCDKTLGVPAAAAGLPCDCPACGTKFRVPADAEPEPTPAPRSRSRPARDEDDEDDRPRRPARRPPRDEDDDEPRARSRRAYDDDDDDDDDRPARRSRPKPKKRRKSRGGGGLPDWYRGPLGRLAENAVVTLLILAVALVSPMASGGLLTAWGFVLMMGGSIWFLVLSGKEGAAQVILNLFVPFYAVFYAVTRWDDVKHPVTVYLIGVAQYLVGAFLFVGPLLMRAQQLQK